MYNIGQNLATTGAGLDTSALNLGSNASALAASSGMLPINTANQIAQDKLGLQDALSQAKTNMYNQRTGGFNAVNQFLGTAGNILQDVLQGQGQNFNMNQANLSNLFSGAGGIVKLMGK